MATRYPGFNSPALDEQGMAICRVVRAHGLSIVRLVNIFSLPEEPISNEVRKNTSHLQMFPNPTLTRARTSRTHSRRSRNCLTAISSARSSPSTVNVLGSQPKSLQSLSLNVRRGANQPCSISEATFPLYIFTAPGYSSFISSLSSRAKKDRIPPKKRRHHHSSRPHSGVLRIIISPAQEALAPADFSTNLLHGLGLLKLHALFIEGGF
ncbi:hypothetical protein B0H19DRAFT_192422 [Mycena capillaripes]|nr:hypothetical protein B0H19DRAFT_192422 [Mycena capillaripes]